MNKSALAIDLTIKYSINDNMYNNTFSLKYKEVQDIINLVIVLIDQFDTRDIEIISSDTYYTDPSKLTTKEAVMEHLITSLEKTKELSLTL